MGHPSGRHGPPIQFFKVPGYRDRLQCQRPLVMAGPTGHDKGPLANSPQQLAVRNQPLPRRKILYDTFQGR